MLFTLIDKPSLIPKLRPLSVLVSQVSFPSTLRLLLGPPVGARKEPLLEGTEMKEESAGAEQWMQFIGRSQCFPTPFRVDLISQQGSEQDGSLLQTISHLMVSTALIYWNSSRKRQDVCPPDIWTFAVSFICPFVQKKARPPQPKASH